MTEALARLSPAAKLIAMTLAKTPDQRERIREQAVEAPSSEVAEKQFYKEFCAAGEKTK